MANTSIIEEVVLEQVPRLIAQLDRNIFSPTYGCFDWNFWHDKVIDAPSGHSQESLLVLSLLYKANFKGNIYFNQPKIKDWCIAAMLYWAAVSFIIAIVTVSLGFTGIAAGTAEIAKILFTIFIILFIISLIFGMRRRRI